MKQIAQNYKSGDLTVLDVPRPACKPGGVVVRSLFSLISTGTEMMKVSEAKMSMLGMAKARPDQVKKVLDAVQQQGVLTTYKKVVNRLDSYTPLGYSLAGVVVEVGAGAEEFTVGQLVAAAGNEFALHAEYNWVPVNLCVPVPHGVIPEHAAFATVGAIAMHGVRRGDVQLGETAVVVGLGLIGQLVVRLLVAAGVRVVGLDIVEERCRLAEKAGAVSCAAPTPEGIASLEHTLGQLTGGIGADHIFLAAGSSSNEPVELAARLARDRARVVDIGKTRLDLPWNAYYDKELDVRFSRSYGPGRYDETYELEGVDYPAGYVRWTERRNLGCFLDLIAAGQLDVQPLISGIFDVCEATDVYARLGSGDVKGIGFLFEYTRDETADTGDSDRIIVAPAGPAVPAQRRTGSRVGAVRIGVIGAGNYASTMLLPHLAKHDHVALEHVATTTALSATNAQRRFGFRTMSTNSAALLADDTIDAVVVATRHHSHARFVCQALEAGKAVFVEKPLALTRDQLDQILATISVTGNDRLMVGFNRRFAPMFAQLKAEFGRPRGPVAARYLVNAGQLDARSWYRNAELEGTRFVGEAGHFIDVLGWFVDSTPVSVHATPGASDDDVQALFRFANGSTATLSYLTTGHARFPKETFDAAADGRSARLDNFSRSEVWTGRRHKARRAMGGQDKGQAAEIAAFVAAVRSGGPMPISLDSLVATTAATFAVEASLVSGRCESV